MGPTIFFDRMLKIVQKPDILTVPQICVYLCYREQQIGRGQDMESRRLYDKVSLSPGKKEVGNKMKAEKTVEAIEGIPLLLLSLGSVGGT